MVQAIPVMDGEKVVRGIVPRFAFDGARHSYVLFRLYGDFLFCWRRKKEAKTALFGPACSRKQWPRACSGFRWPTGCLPLADAVGPRFAASDRL